MSKRFLLVVLAVVLVVGLVDVAQAFWRGSGSGPGSANTGTAVTVTLTPGSPGVDLYPGAKSDVALTVTNPNLVPVRISSLVLDSNGIVVDTGHTGCATTTFTFTPQNNGGGGWTVPARAGSTNGTLPVTLTNALAMSADAANACQGAQPTVYLKASP